MGIACRNFINTPTQKLMSQLRRNNSENRKLSFGKVEADTTSQSRDFVIVTPVEDSQQNEAELIEKLKTAVKTRFKRVTEKELPDRTIGMIIENIITDQLGNRDRLGYEQDAMKDALKKFDNPGKDILAKSLVYIAVFDYNTRSLFKYGELEEFLRDAIKYSKNTPFETQPEKNVNTIRLRGMLADHCKHKDKHEIEDNELMKEIEQNSVLKDIMDKYKKRLKTTPSLITQVKDNLSNLPETLLTHIKEVSTWFIPQNCFVPHCIYNVMISYRDAYNKPFFGADKLEYYDLGMYIAEIGIKIIDKQGSKDPTTNALYKEFEKTLKYNFKTPPVEPKNDSEYQSESETDSGYTVGESKTDSESTTPPGGIEKKCWALQVLGLTDTNGSLTNEELTKVYRIKALKFHPDKNPGDKAAEKNFKRVANAFAILILYYPRK